MKALAILLVLVCTSFAHAQNRLDVLEKRLEALETIKDDVADIKARLIRLEAKLTEPQSYQVQSYQVQPSQCANGSCQVQPQPSQCANGSCQVQSYQVQSYQAQGSCSQGSCSPQRGGIFFRRWR